MESAEKTLSEMVSATDFDTTRFFVEEDKSAQRDPEAIVQEMKAKRQEIEDFYTKVCCCFSRHICDNYVPQWWVELEDELSWLFTNRISTTR